MKLTILTNKNKKKRDEEEVDLGIEYKKNSSITMKILSIRKWEGLLTLH